MGHKNARENTRNSMLRLRGTVTHVQTAVEMSTKWSMYDWLNGWLIESIHERMKEWTKKWGMNQQLKGSTIQ